MTSPATTLESPRLNWSGTFATRGLPTDLGAVLPPIEAVPASTVPLWEQAVAVHSRYVAMNRRRVELGPLIDAAEREHRQARIAALREGKAEPKDAAEALRQERDKLVEDLPLLSSAAMGAIRAWAQAAIQEAPEIRATGLRKVTDALDTLGTLIGDADEQVADLETGLAILGYPDRLTVSPRLDVAQAAIVRKALATAREELERVRAIVGPR